MTTNGSPKIYTLFAITGSSDHAVEQPAEAGGAREVGGGVAAAHARRSLAGALANMGTFEAISGQ